VTERRIEKLTGHHAVDRFDCGEEPLNQYLIRHALQNQLAHAAQTYVGLVGDEVIGFYSLSAGEIAFADAAERLKKGLARHPVPIMLLARLAVDHSWHGQGVGRALLADATRRTLEASNIAGIRALVVHAKNDAARSFYLRFSFTPSLPDSFHLYMLTKDLHRITDMS
jgi:GNAT superfamily N-acetyltransferase